MQRLTNLARLGVASGHPLAVDGLAIDVNLEDAAAGRNDRELADVVAVGLKQLGRQTGGSRCVASNRAVLDSDVHGFCPTLTDRRYPHRR